GETVLFVIGDAEVGGGQIAGIRLANELSKHHRLFLCNARPEVVDEAVVAMVGPNVAFLEGTLGITPWALQSRTCEINRLYEGTRRVAVVRDLLRFHGIDRLISQIWWADRFTLAVNRGLGIPWFIQMHGCYEALLEHPDWDRGFGELATEIMNV